MKCKAIFHIVVFLLLAGCAAHEEPGSQKDARSLITRDDYENLESKQREKEPVAVDYKEGVMGRSIDTMPKISQEESIQEKFLYIATYGSVEELQLRYENGGKVNYRNKQGETALIKVLEGPYDNQTFLKLKFLVSVGANINFKGNSKTSKNTTPLNVAVGQSSSVFTSSSASQNPFFAEQILTYLIDQGALIYGSDINGWTPLHTAARSNNIFAAQLLIESGAVVMQEDYFGRTPLHLARSREMERILKEHGAVETTDPFPDFDPNSDSNKQRRRSEELWEPLRDVKPF